MNKLRIAIIVAILVIMFGAHCIAHANWPGLLRAIHGI